MKCRNPFGVADSFCRVTQGTLSLNRANPGLSDAIPLGLFGWDVLLGHGRTRTRRTGAEEKRRRRSLTRSAAALQIAGFGKGRQDSIQPDAVVGVPLRHVGEDHLVADLEAFDNFNGADRTAAEFDQGADRAGTAQLDTR